MRLAKLERIRGRISRINRPELLTHHPVEQDSHAFDETEKDASNNSAADHVLGAIPGCHDGTGSSTAHDRVQRVLLLPEMRKGAVKGGEAKTPRRKLTSEDRSAFFHPREASQGASGNAGRSVPGAVDHVEEGAANQPHCERTAGVVDNSPWTGNETKPF